MIKISSLIRGIGVGASYIFFWLVACICSWIFDTMLAMFISSILSAVALCLLLNQKNIRDFLISFLMGIVSGSICFLCVVYFGVIPAALNILFPGYGRMTAGGGFELMVVTIFYFIITSPALLLSLFISWDTDKISSFNKNKK